MLKKIYPYSYEEDVLSINYRKLYKLGFKGIIFDIDNTLVHHGENSTKEIDSLFKILKNIGFKTLLLTNNDEERVLRFIKNIDTLYIFDAKKPNKQSYEKAIELLNLSKEEVICIGDQIFIDILGANKAGIPSILVKYIGYYKEKKIGKRRYLEKIILKFYKNSKYKNRLGDISTNRGDL